LKNLDSGFRRNDKKVLFLTYYEFIKIRMTKTNAGLCFARVSSRIFNFSVMSGEVEAATNVFDKVAEVRGK